MSSPLLSLGGFPSPVILTNMERRLVRKAWSLQSRNQARDPSTLPKVSVIVQHVIANPHSDNITLQGRALLPLEKVNSQLNLIQKSQLTMIVLVLLVYISSCTRAGNMTLLKSQILQYFTSILPPTASADSQLYCLSCSADTFPTSATTKYNN